MAACEVPARTRTSGLAGACAAGHALSRGVWRQELLGVAAVMGTLLALAGVAVISRSPLQRDVPLLSVLAVVGGAICFAKPWCW